MVQPKSDHGSEYYRMRLLAGLDYYLVYVGQGLQWSRMYAQWVDNYAGILPLVSPTGLGEIYWRITDPQFPCDSGSIRFDQASLALQETRIPSR
jgi:hypothetical protein